MQLWQVQRRQPPDNQTLSQRAWCTTPVPARSLTLTWCVLVAWENWTRWLSTRSIAKFPLRRLGVDVSRHGGSTSTGERTATRRCEAGLWPWSSTCTSETM